MLWDKAFAAQQKSALAELMRRRGCVIYISVFAFSD